MQKNYLLLLAAILFILSAEVNAGKLTVNYSFGKPLLNTNSEGYTEVVFNECFNRGDEGTPLLPWYGADLLIPQGEIITAIHIINSNYYEVINDIRILPASRLFPVSQSAENYKPQPDMSIYGNDQPYPSDIISGMNTGFLAGHSIGTFSVCPLIYYPLQSQVRFLREITLEIVTGPAPEAIEAIPLLRNANNIKSKISQLVENPESLGQYTYPEDKNSDESDILLITKSTLLPAFAEYIAFKESTGFIVSAITTEDIYAEYPGPDQQSKIRNCVKEYYQNFGISFLILGGDADHNNANENIVPHRGFFAIDDYDIPSDMYYSCLDGNWNTDGDNKWGEPGEYDLYEELSVGRICADNATEIQNFTNKLKLYQNSPVVADIEKALMLGEMLNNNPITWGGDYKDEVAYGSSEHGFTTTGVSSNFDIHILYDREGGWDKYDLFNKFNQVGINLLNHLGHSSTTYNMKMDNSDVNTSNFQNNGITKGFVIGYSQGCYNGAFDNRDWDLNYGQDCFAEKITTIATAEVATVANSRYGWYAPGNTNSSSQYIDRQFYDAIFGENINAIGQVNADSKEDNGSYFNTDGYMRWTAYELNLFGDPSMDIWTAVPGLITASYPQAIPIGTMIVQFQTNTPYARIGLVQDGELIGRSLADYNGNAQVELFGPVVSSSPISVSVIAHNKSRHQGSINIITDQPFVMFNALELNDAGGNNNGQADYGESLLLGLSLKNAGNEPAYNVTAVISEQDPYLSITDNTEFYGDFEPGQIIVLTDVFAFEVSDEVPDGHEFDFILTAQGDSSWTSYFTISACAPAFMVGTLTIDDSQGNNNGMLEPGETAGLTVTVSNSGHSPASTAIATLAALSGYIDVTGSSFEIQNLEPGETDQTTFTVSADASAPLGMLAMVEYQIHAGAYSGEAMFPLKLGNIIEDFENGNFNTFDWSSSGHADWIVSSTGSYQGVYSARSGDLEENQFSILMLSYESMDDDSISFYRKVSSEDGYDFLQFYVDNQKVAEWSGEKNWQKVSFAVPGGDHNFKWIYDKDQYVSNGSDCAWIDYISLPIPMTTTAYAGPDATQCGSTVFHCEASTATSYNSLTWTSSGSGNFNNHTILHPFYTPSEQDIASGSVVLTLLAQGGEQNATDHMTLAFEPGPVITMDQAAIACTAVPYIPAGITAQNYANLEWSTSGDGSFNNITILEASYTPGPNDLLNGSVTLSLTAEALYSCEPVTSSCVLTVMTSPVVELGADTSVCLDAIVTLDAGNPGAAYLWSGGETTQTITVVSGGIENTQTFSVIVEGANGCTAEDDIILTFEDCAGIDEGREMDLFVVYPNPGNGAFTIRRPAGFEGDIQVEIVNILGKRIYSCTVEPGEENLDLQWIPAGIYSLMITNDRFRSSLKLDIKK